MRRRPGSPLVLAAVVGAMHAACGTEVPEPPMPGPDPLALAAPQDKDPDPAVLELDLEARPATKALGAATETPVWTFGGSIPGPFLEAKVGDRLVVNFKNALPEPTTIHWHGIRLPAACACV